MVILLLQYVRNWGCAGYCFAGYWIVPDSSLPDTGQEKMMTGYRIITGIRIITRYSHTIIY
jgi:hypothetical protein